MPPTLITLIMNMIASTRLHILWNRTPLSKVVPSRGVRQGDPLSPYLFVLCLERLSLKLEEAVRCKLLHPINFRARIRLPHLFFADDIFLFTKATTRDCKNLCRILQKFCDSSGQLMSVTKSRLWFSPSTPRRIKEQVAGILGFPPLTALVAILARPFSPPTALLNLINIKWITYACKLKDGKPNISMAGRATFVKASVTSILIYAMQTTLLPQKISHQIDKMSSNFL